MYSSLSARFRDFFNFFRKKVVKIFAGSDFVVTFASAFEKSTVLTRSKVYNKGAGSPCTDGGDRKNATFLKKYLQD